MASETVYTVGRWVVKEGQEAAFVEAWKDLGTFFLGLDRPPGTGTLLRSASDPRLFYSFGPWPDAEAVAAMRAHPQTPDAIGKVAALCDEAVPGMFNVVAYFTKDTGVVGVLITGAVTFGMLVMISSGEALKALGMTVICFALWGVVGDFIVERTPLNIDDLAGYPRVISTGGLEAEPITEEDNERLQKTGLKKEGDDER